MKQSQMKTLTQKVKILTKEIKNAVFLINFLFLKILNKILKAIKLNKIKQFSFIYLFF